MSRRRGILGSGQPDTSREDLVSAAIKPERATAASPLDLARASVNPFRKPKPNSRPSTIDYTRR
jgi:hypothetical protein